ncbi:hypothetical protein ACIQBJ_05340 [Kitasatospora sp. NPDC088391]|uniref:hypothetical protein n=1 Tax=Kitasatospora sp. NPDC088391 TaxID=3364074 RepID=UPI0037F1A4E5
MNQWEDLLSLVAPAVYATRDTRTAVVDPKEEWIAGHKVEITNRIKESGGDNEVWFSWNFMYSYTMTTYDGNSIPSYTNMANTGSVVVSLTTKDDFIGPSTAYGKFLQDGQRVINSLLSSNYNNDRASPATFLDACYMLMDVKAVLEKWIPIAKGWATDVGSPGSDWQGSAAGSFSAVLTGYYREMQTLYDKLSEVDLVTALFNNGMELARAMLQLAPAWDTWKALKESSPQQSLNKALYEGLTGARVHLAYGTANNDHDFWENQGKKPPAGVDGDPSSASSFTLTFTGAKFGDPKTDDFWLKVKERAKAIWMEDLRTLDEAAKNALTGVETSYHTTSGLMALHSIGDAILKLPFSAPPAPPGIDDPGKGGPGGDGTGGNGKFDINSLGGGSGGGGGGTGGGTGGGKFDLGGGPGGGGTGGIGGIGGNKGTTGGGGTDLIGGGIGGIGGIGTGGSSTDNKPVTVPAGSRITDDGRIVDANGKPVLDANGNPMVAGKDYTIGPDGVVRDGKGNPIPQYRQLLADKYSGSGGGSDLLTPSHFGTGGFSYSTGGPGLGAGGSGVGGISGMPSIFGTGGGIGSKALAGGADPVTVKAAADQANAERMAAEKAARAAAQEQALLTGRQTPTSSGGMPMMPGGGMGSPGGQGEKDRRRTTWLAEDEEVWGTDTGAVHGVIGR